MVKFWGKFHPLFESDLKVGFETTFPRGGVKDIDPSYKINGLIHDSAKEPVVRIYEPAVAIIGSCKSSAVAHIYFEPISSDKAKYRRLVFTRNVSRRTKKPWNRIVAARHGEIEHFGFDSWNSKDERYLSLAYPGNSFIPVYFKIQGNGFAYVEVYAWEKDGKVIIQGRRIVEESAPKVLLSAVLDSQDQMRNISA